MDESTDLELANNVKSRCCDRSLKELIERHSALCIDIYKKYTPALCASGVPYRDIYDDKDYLVYKSALTYNPNKKAKFSTWLGNQVRYHCLNTINKKNKLVRIESNEELDYFAMQAEVLEEKKYDIEIEYIFLILSKLKDSRIKKVFTLRYFGSDKKRMPWAQIGKEMGVSTQTAINLHRRGIKMLNKKMKSNDPDII